MKTNENYILRDIAGESILVPTGDASRNYSGMINLNETAAFIFRHVNEASDFDEIAKKMTEEFDIDYETALKDVTGLLTELSLFGIVEL